MQKLLSILLIPSKNDENYLNKIIRNLGIHYHAPIFIPHLTIFADTIIEPETLKSIADEVFKSVKPFKVKVKKINHSEAFFKTVFIEFHLNKDLKNLFTILSKKTDKRAFSTFKPHISLIYKNMPEKERLKIIKTLNIKEEFEIGRVIINAPKEGEKDFLDVEHWQFLYEKTLGINE
jgi:2'-5' RNA ligase